MQLPKARNRMILKTPRRRVPGTRGLVKGVAKGVGSLGQSTVVNLVGVVKNTAEGVATNCAGDCAELLWT